MDEIGFAKELLRMAAILDFPPNLNDRSTFLIWYEALSDLGLDRLKSAITLAIKTETRFPKPAILRKLAEGNILTEEQIGADIASMIEACIGPFGRNAMDEGHMLRQTLIDRLGPIGLMVVDRCGGWKNLCVSMEGEDLISARKKWREMAATKHKKLDIFGEDSAIGLPSAAASNFLRIEKGNDYVA